MTTTAAALPLTVLSEEERMFREAVRDFAGQEVRPRVAVMEQQSALQPELIKKVFELGLMGIQIPEEHGGAGGTLFMTVLAVEELSAVDASDKLGIRASSTTELILDHCEVPEENVVGEVGKGYKVAIETLNTGRIGIGAQMIGVARGALQAATQYVQERQQFGKPVAEFQAVQFQLAQAATELEAARLEDAGEPYTMEAALFSSQVAERVTSLCVELFGGYGYTTEYPVEKFYRDAKIGTIYEGTSNMQLHTIAKMLLRDRQSRAGRA